MQLDQRWRLPDDISTHGSGVLKKREGTVELPLREDCRLMMVRSDNMAFDLLPHTVGLGTVNRFLEITLVGFGALTGKGIVVRIPGNQCRWLVASEVGLPLWIERRVGSVAVEELDLDVLVAGAIQQKLVVEPVVWSRRPDAAHAVCVLPLRGLDRQ